MADERTTRTEPTPVENPPVPAPTRQERENLPQPTPASEPARPPRE